MASTFTPNLGLEVPAHGDYASTGWDTPMDASLTKLDTSYGGYLNLAVTGGTVALTLAQASNPVIIVTGTLTSNCIITFPPIAGRRLIIPNCVMNGFALFVRGNNGADTNGIYFWIQWGVPYGIVVTPSRVYWDYGALDVTSIVDKPLGFPGNGWLPCDGRFVSMQMHDLLYDVIGGTYGISGTFPTGSFRLPDFRGTTRAMADQIGLIPATGPFAQNLGNRGILNSWGLNTFGGEANHVLSIGEMPSHNHIDSGHTHPATQDAHNHNYVHTDVGHSGIAAGGSFAGTFTDVTSTAQPAVHVGVGSAVISFTGGNAGHNNVQPTTTTMAMIKW